MAGVEVADAVDDLVVAGIDTVSDFWRLLACEHSQTGEDGVGEGVEVVAAFEDECEAAIGVAVCNVAH